MKQPKKRITIFADLDLEHNWTKLANGVSHEALAKALVQHAIHTSFLPFGGAETITETQDEETIFDK